VRVYLGSDHAGFVLKGRLIEWLKQAGHDPLDCGPSAERDDDDYPPYVMRAADAAVHDPSNKIAGVRAAIAWSEETAQLARLHNNANVLSLGARMYSVADAVSFTRVFVETAFSGESRHARRLAMITDYEATGELPALPADP